MRKVVGLSLVLVLVLTAGCTSLSKGPWGSKGVKSKKQTAKKVSNEEQDEEEEKFAEGEEEDEQAKTGDENIFDQPARGRKRIKESDKLDELFKGLIDPRTTEINRNLGYD